MEYADEARVYHESDWAARRWDWFNEGRLVAPKSFCQLWRTVLLYATVAYFVRPFERLLVSLPSIPIPAALGKGGWFALRAGGRGSWFLLRAAVRCVWLLTLPLRIIGRPRVSPTLAAAERAGNRIRTFGDKHEYGLTLAWRVFLIVEVGAIVTFIAIALLLESWFWTLVGVGGIVVTGFAAYGLLKSGAFGLMLDVLGLLSNAALAAKHGVCPPVRIIRAP